MASEKLRSYPIKASAKMTFIGLPLIPKNAALVL